MKKFCSKCGNQLDLSKKSCTACHAFNPYFISGFRGSLNNDIENNTPAANDLAALQLEEAKQKQLQAEELQKQQKERELLEQNLKSELNKVKEETEQYKKETQDLVKGVQKELHDIEKENQLLKEKVESLKSNNLHEERAPLNLPVQQPEPQPKSDKKSLVMAAVVLLFIATGASYFFFRSHNKPAETPAASTQPALPVNVKTETAKVEHNTPAVKDTAHSHKLIAAAVPTAMPLKPVTPVAAASAPLSKPTAGSFALTANKVITDLVGKKLSGCDITIANSTEIEHVDNLALVEKLSSSYLKYKCTLKIKQGADVFTSSPYIYYSAEGTFIKVDGTNCE